mmetsp:Transcript_20335/g.36512  ORF Transcript_20335/g.36512 Transcript_20335/m.36512 type:complete len:96 (+) Transcript_20335:346-633(+)
MHISSLISLITNIVLPLSNHPDGRNTSNNARRHETLGRDGLEDEALTNEKSQSDNKGKKCGTINRLIVDVICADDAQCARNSSPSSEKTSKKIRY